IGVDPTNPNIVYVGGSRDQAPSGFVRVDVSAISDTHSFFLANDRNDGGRPRIGTNDTNGVQDNVRLANWPDAGGNIIPGLALNPVQAVSLPPFSLQYPTINLYRYPDDPFNAGSTIFVSNVSAPPNPPGIAKSGLDAKWFPFEIGAFDTDQHRLITM